MRRAFTLVEVVISVPLSLVVLYAATAAFRAASISTTIANRLSLENTLMREGMHRAHDELDFWTDYDDPADPANQALRPMYQDTTSSGNQWRGLPFTPMQALQAKAVFARGGAPGTEIARGWDPANDSWQPHDPRTWFRGNLAEKATTPERNKNNTITMPEGDLRYGRYALISSVSSSFTDDELSHDGNAQIPSWNGFDKGPFLDERIATPYPGSAPIPPYSAGNTVTVPHTWYPNQVDGALSGLGFYGAMDYLPANTIWAYYQPYHHVGTASGAYDATSLGGWPLWMVHLGGGHSALWYYSEILLADRTGAHGDTKGSGTNTPRSSYDLSSGGTYMMPNPHAPVPAGFPISLSDYRYRISRNTLAINIGESGGASLLGVGWAVAATAQFIPLLDQRPATWPDVDVTVSHLFTNGRWVNVCRVQRISPSTGEVVELSFTGMGTTLRGARAQRAPGGGWAQWDNSAGFDPASHPNLDSY